MIETWFSTEVQNKFINVLMLLYNRNIVTLIQKYSMHKA